ncbi:MAG TPA: hypothetical protein PKY59_00495 [Pyrinomonadaceae bacterium]|nr:hypothetical protein [Pyrinomonadaceae bacterium]
MKNQKNQTKFTSLMTALFIVTVGLFAAQNASAQRYLSELKPTTEVKGISQFAANLGEFLNLADSFDNAKGVSPADVAKLEAAGKKVKDGTSNFRQSLDSLIAKIKKDNRWNEAFDSEVVSELANRKIKGFFQNHGGRKILSEGLTAIANINREVDTIVNNAKSRQMASNFSGEVFMKTAFAASASAKKVRFKCVLLGVAIFGAEVIKADRTAENLDGIFDKSCGSGAAVTQ